MVSVNLEKSFEIPQWIVWGPLLQVSFQIWSSRLSYGFVDQLHLCSPYSRGEYLKTASSQQQRSGTHGNADWCCWLIVWLWSGQRDTLFHGSQFFGGGIWFEMNIPQSELRAYSIHEWMEPRGRDRWSVRRHSWVILGNFKGVMEMSPVGHSCSVSQPQAIHVDGSGGRLQTAVLGVIDGYWCPERESTGRGWHSSETYTIWHLWETNRCLRLLR